MADHIRITALTGTFVVRAGGAIIGESERVLELTEGGYPPVYYFPREDIAMGLLDPSDRRTTCPWKGEASYFSIQTKSTLLKDAVWSYDDPKPEVARIAGHLAFYPDRVTVEELM
jgi:uncharacterized protein (DUF427 family)